MHEYQRRAEAAIVEDWAEEMGRRGHPLCNIKSNEDDPPDVLAVMGGNLIGIEVTMLVEYVPEHQVGVRVFRRDSPPDEGGSRIAAQCGSQSIPKYMPIVCEWTLEQFQIRLDEIARRKNKQACSKKAQREREQGEHALDWRLHRRILLIFSYPQDCLAEHLATTELSRPEHFDCVFVMGDYVPDGGSGHHPVFEVSLSA